jgi:Domain of unknown function (DUF4440)
MGTSLARLSALRGAIVVASLVVSPISVGTQQRPSTELLAWFEKTEQSLMDAVGVGDKGPWERVMDDECVVTTEEGQLISKSQFLADLRPLPAGLAGGIAVRQLTVQEYPTFAVVRFLADEWETVFGQRLTTQYRVTDTYRRVDSTWKMVASHFAVVTNDPPAQKVATDGWPGLEGRYQLLPDGWTFHVVLRKGKLYGGRDPARLRPLIPLTPDAFVLEGTLGEWLFVVGRDGRATHIVNFRKFEPLLWTRVEAAR